MHLLEDEVLGEVVVQVVLLLLLHGLGNLLHGGKVLRHLLLLLLDSTSHQHLLDPWDLEAGHLRGEGEEPAHETHLSRVVDGGGHLKPGVHLLLAVVRQ